VALNDFHSACRNWYIVEFGAPTPAQAEAWSAIRSGRHTLISAPTGSRKTLAAFYAAPPWRVLLHTLRKMKLRGVLRGGRFVSGAGGEQFALPETVEKVRKFKQSKGQDSKHLFYCLAASDPLNLINLILPNQKLTRQLNNRVLYRGGIPIAVLDSGEIHFMHNVNADQ